jgi:hypothetical protein
VDLPSVSRPACCLTLRQRSGRRRSHQLSLARAVRRAVDDLFRFQYRDPRHKALWSATERVWLGGETYLYWAFWDGEIDIPWVVATARDAPEDTDDLRKMVRAELKAYWAERTASLPRKRPHSLPLP